MVSSGDYVNRNEEGEWLMDAAALRFEAALDEESRLDAQMDYEESYWADYDPYEYEDDYENDDFNEED